MKVKTTHYLIFHVFQDLPRTNNNVEGWHRRFGALIAAHHPTIWKFLEFLIGEHRNSVLILARINVGEMPGPSRRRYKQINDNLKTLVQRREEGVTQGNIPDTLTFLRGIAHNLAS